MKAKLIAALFAALVIITPTEANAQTAEITFGVVLDDEGNGLALDPGTLTPVDPYYNYISYAGLGAKPGQYVITLETLNRYGECEEREDHLAKLTPATPSEIAAYRQAADEGIYCLDGLVTNKGEVTTVDGNIWDYNTYDLKPGEAVRLVLYDNGTEGKHDDVIKQLQWGL